MPTFFFLFSSIRKYQLSLMVIHRELEICGRLCQTTLSCSLLHQQAQGKGSGLEKDWYVVSLADYG